MQEGQYVQYPRPPVKEIDFGALSEGFNLIWRNLLPFAIASFCSLAVVFAVSQLMSWMMLPFIGQPPTIKDPAEIATLYAYILKQNVFTTPINLLAGALVSPFYLSMAIMTLKLVKGQSVEVNDAFAGFSRFGQVFGLYLLMQIAIYIGALFCCLPLFIVGGLMMFSLPLMADRDLGPIDAVKESIALLKDHWLMAALFYFVIGLCSGLGTLACCIGIIVSMPLLYVCPVLVYRDFTMGKGDPIVVTSTAASNPETPYNYPPSTVEPTPPTSAPESSYEYPPEIKPEDNQP